MKKLIFTAFIFIACIFITTKVVTAQQAQNPTPTFTPTPTPTATPYILPTPTVTPTPLPQPATTGGSCGETGLRCCKTSEKTSVNIDTNSKAFCINIVFELCLSSLFNNIQEFALNSMQLDKLDGLETCNTGVPQYTESSPGSGSFSCMCANLPKSSVEDTKLCSQYIAPDVAKQKGIKTYDPNINLGTNFLPSDALNPQPHYKIDTSILESDHEYMSCANCFRQGGYYSGLGCIYTSNWKDLIEKNIFGWGLGLAGIIAVGCITFAAVQFQLSQGDAEKIKKSRELITSCIMGLMLIIFSIFILKVIGVDILAIPGFK